MGCSGCQCVVAGDEATTVVTGNGSVLNPFVVTALGDSAGFSRSTASYTTGMLSPGASENATVNLAKSYRLLRIATSGAARVRAYSAVAERTADILRPWGVDPAPGVGLVLDFLTEGVFSGNLSPLSDGSSSEAAPSVVVPIRIESVLGGPVTVDLRWIRTE